MGIHSQFLSCGLTHLVWENSLGIPGSLLGSVGNSKVLNTLVEKMVRQLYLPTRGTVCGQVHRRSPCSDPGQGAACGDRALRCRIIGKDLTTGMEGETSVSSGNRMGHTDSTTQQGPSPRPAPGHRQTSRGLKNRKFPSR